MDIETFVENYKQYARVHTYVGTYVPMYMYISG
jgi:hypothetical protein